MVCVQVAFHENDGNHENDENDEHNSDSYKPWKCESCFSNRVLVKAIFEALKCL